MSNLPDTVWQIFFDLEMPDAVWQICCCEYKWKNCRMFRKFCAEYPLPNFAVSFRIYRRRCIGLFRVAKWSSVTVLRMLRVHALESKKAANFDLLKGGDKGRRTPDLLNAIETLYQLSYIPMS